MTDRKKLSAKRLALGTVQFGLPYGVANKSGQVSEQEARRIVNLARSCDLNVVDTAIGYQDSEACLGKVGVSKLKVVSKIPAIPEGQDDPEQWLLNQIVNSLGRLNISRMHGVLLHRPMELLGAKGQALYNGLLRAQSLGLSSKIGVSVYAPEELETLFSRFDFGLVQCPLNLVDRRVAESGWLRKLNDRGVETHTRSTFLQGLLLLPEEEIPDRFLKWKYLWRQWQDWLRANNITALQACLGYALSKHEVDHVLVGVDSCVQLQQIIEAISNKDIMDFPDISSTDEYLINPAKWSLL